MLGVIFIQRVSIFLSAVVLSAFPFLSIILLSFLPFYLTVHELDAVRSLTEPKALEKGASKWGMCI